MAEASHDGSEVKIDSGYLGRIFFNLAFMLLAAILVALGAGYLIDNAGMRPVLHLEQQTGGTLIEKSIAGQQLVIPSTMFRFEDQKGPAFTEKLDLQISVPLGFAGRIVPIHVSFVPRSKARASTRLLDSVYLRQFMAGQVNGAPGLVGKPLKAADGFQNETVWYDAISADPFVAKCAASPTSDTGSAVPDKPQPELCLRTVILTDRVAAVYSFESGLLGRWRDFDTVMRPVLRGIGAL